MPLCLSFPVLLSLRSPCPLLQGKLCYPLPARAPARQPHVELDYRARRLRRPLLPGLQARPRPLAHLRRQRRDVPL